MMKRLVLVALVALFSAVGWSVELKQTACREALRESVQRLDSVQSIGELQMCRNEFERIAQNCPTEWLAAYYLAYTTIEQLYWEPQSPQNNSRLTEAKRLLEGLDKMEGADRSEVATLWGYYYMAAVSSDPSKGRELFQPCISKFEEAMELNPANPRAVVLLAMFEQHLPPFIKSKRNPAEELQRASQLFDREQKRQKQSGELVEPHWGRSFMKFIGKE